MKRVVSFLLLGTLFVISFRSNAYSDAVGAAEDMYSVLDENGETAARDAVNGSGFDLNKGLSSIGEIAASNFEPILLAALRSSCKLLLIALIFSLCSNLCGDSDLLLRGVNIGVTGVVAAVGINEVGSGLQIAIDHQNSLSEFMDVLLPTLTAVGAAGGSGGEALLLQSGVTLFCKITVNAYSKFFVPFLYCYIAVRLGGVLSDNGFFRKTADWAKGIVTGAMRIWLLLFFAYLSICGIAGKAADSLALRSAKTAASSVPYIGGVAAEAADAVTAGASVIRGYLGVFGTVGIIGAAVVPLLSCGLGWVCFKLSGLLSSCLPNACGSEAIEIVAEAFGFVFSLCTASTALVLMSVIICVKTVGAV